MNGDRAHVYKLTAAELDVLRLMACGLPYAQIAAIRGSSVRTVHRGHAQEILRKLGVRSQLQAAVYAWRNGIISVNEAWATLQQYRGAT